MDPSVKYFNFGLFRYTWGQTYSGVISIGIQNPTSFSFYSSVVFTTKYQHIICM